MTKKQALKQLKETGELTTAMLKPLGIPFEGFLRFAQMSDDKCKEVVKKILAHFKVK